ncbi:hypothetical protein FBU59_004347, partial [Linderina macrospora]
MAGNSVVSNEPTQTATARTGSSSDLDSEMQSNKPLFLNFTAELAPFSASKKQKKKSNVYKVSGVNILNRNSVDSKTALERLQRRRENHNFVERRRRDNINHTITTLSTLIPYCTEEGVKLNKGSILHMAVEYIQDLQDINAALVEENIRLGGTGDIKVPARRSSNMDKQETETAPGSPEGMSLSSAAPSPQVGPVRNGSGSSQKTPSAPGSRATSSGLPSPINGSSDRPLAATLAETQGVHRSTLPSLTAAVPAHHMSGAISPPATTATPSAVQSTNTSPATQATAVTGAIRTIPPVTQLPPPSHNVQNSGMLPSLAPPMTPRHAAGVSAAMTLPTVPETSSIASIAPPIAPLPRFSFPAGAGKFQSRPPAQSMPNSPSFQPRNGHAGDMQANGFANHPFFNTMGPAGHRGDDVPSFRHHIQHHSGGAHPQQYAQQHMPGMPVRKNGLTPPQQHRQHP